MPAIDEVLQQGRYRILHRFGQNGAGAVYEAYDNNLKTNVVLKEILVKLKKVMTLAQQQTLKLAFASEAKILTEITHESFQRVHDYFSEIDRNQLTEII
jgi:serine/threonine protein kinase